MEKYLLDTNICVFIMRGKYNVGKRIRSIGIENCAISEITVAELLYGAQCSDRPDEISQLVKEFCSEFEIVPIWESLDVYAQNKSVLRKEGRMIDDFDLLIGCGAISRDYVLVTDNLKHFGRLPVRLENWVER